MPSHNRVTLLGNVTRDAELRSVGSSNKASFGLACSESYKDKRSGEWKEVPMFIDIDTFGTAADRIGETVRKGQLVLVEGRLRFDQWVDQKTGAKRSKHYIVSDRVLQMVHKPSNGEAPSRPMRTVAAEALEDESVPF